MSLLSFQDVGISGISAVVPKCTVNNYDTSSLFSENEIQKIVNMTGIIERRKADPKICSSDLCFNAAQELMNKMKIASNQIDLLIFLSQTPDYRQPATAPILQYRLGLPKTVGAFDINLACSGFIYGLSTAFAYASIQGIDRVLLLVGETLSKIVSDRDRATSLLFGDAATAILIEKNPKYAQSFFSLNSDGSGSKILYIPSGGYRSQSNSLSTEYKACDDGSIRSDENLYMDGMEVFNFTMREIPSDIKRLIAFSQTDLSNINYICFHQANKFMTNYIVEKLKYPLERVPYSLDKYGNTSAVSIPLTIVSELREKLKKNDKVLMSGFGGGLSWGSALITFNDVCIPSVVEV
jgi:3-oxoacyl-[acyl-carrier-protein] synthase III